jgi:hypothetical protein
LVQHNVHRIRLPLSRAMIDEGKEEVQLLVLIFDKEREKSA